MPMPLQKRTETRRTVHTEYTRRLCTQNGRRSSENTFYLYIIGNPHKSHYAKIYLIVYFGQC